MDNNNSKSIPSIEQYIDSHKITIPKDSYLSSKKSMESKISDMNLSSSSHIYDKKQQSINTPAYRNNPNDRDLKKSIISKLKKDIKEEKSKNSQCSDVDEYSIVGIDSKISKNKNQSSFLSNNIDRKKTK